MTYQKNSTPVQQVLERMAEIEIRRMNTDKTRNVHAPLNYVNPPFNHVRNQDARQCVWSFTLDGCRKVTAIIPHGATLDEIERQLQNQYGPGRVTDVRAQL